MSLVLTVAGLLTWISVHNEIEAKEKAAAYVRELPQFCAQLREIFHWDEALVDPFNSDCKSVGRDEVAEKRAAYLRDLPRLCAQLREEKKRDELLVEWANSDCKGVKS